MGFRLGSWIPTRWVYLRVLLHLSHQFLQEKGNGVRDGVSENKRTHVNEASRKTHLMDLDLHLQSLL